MSFMVLSCRLLARIWRAVNGVHNRERRFTHCLLPCVSLPTPHLQKHFLGADNNPRSTSGAFFDNSGGFRFSDSNTTATRPSNVISVAIPSDVKDPGTACWQCLSLALPPSAARVDRLPSQHGLFLLAPCCQLFLPVVHRMLVTHRLRGCDVGDTRRGSRDRCRRCSHRLHLPRVPGSLRAARLRLGGACVCEHVPVTGCVVLLLVAARV
jgi:hypothetical protein